MEEKFDFTAQKEENFDNMNLQEDKKEEKHAKNSSNEETGDYVCKVKENEEKPDLFDNEENTLEENVLTEDIVEKMDESAEEEYRNLEKLKLDVDIEFGRNMNLRKKTFIPDDDRSDYPQIIQVSRRTQSRSSSSVSSPPPTSSSSRRRTSKWSRGGKGSASLKTFNLIEPSSNMKTIGTEKNVLQSEKPNQTFKFRATSSEGNFYPIMEQDTCQETRLRIGQSNKYKLMFPNYSQPGLDSAGVPAQHSQVTTVTASEKLWTNRRREEDHVTSMAKNQPMGDRVDLIEPGGTKSSRNMSLSTTKLLNL